MSVIKQLSISQACAALSRGECLIYPTETFYGVGCNALDPDAVGKIFSLKKRDMSMPLPVVISSVSDLERLVSFIPDTAQKLMDIFWPGPLSIVFPALPTVPELLTAGKWRIAVRFSPHPAARMLSEKSGLILVSSSANISGEAPVTHLSSIAVPLWEGVAGVYDLPPQPAGGLPSTVVDIVPGPDGETLRICREGMISAEDLEAEGFTVSFDTIILA